MIEGLDISLAELRAHFTGVVPQIGTLRGVEKFAAGQSNPTYKLICDEGVYVLRAKPPGDLLPSAHMVEREFRVMDALAETNVPVPRMIHLEQGNEAVLNRSFFLMEHLDGRIFWDPTLPDLHPAERGEVYDGMNATLAALHDVDIAAVGLSDFGKPTNYFARQISRWSKQYTASALVPDPVMLVLMDWLEEHSEMDDGQVSLVHGDYRLDNLVFAKSGGQVIGVLDWELSTLGHPYADLAYQCMQWRLPYKAALRGLGGVDRAEIGLPSERDYVERYLQRRGREPIENWPVFLVFSFFRLAAILEGVGRRAHDGNASNPALARDYAKAVPLLAEMAQTIIEGGAE